VRNLAIGVLLTVFFMVLFAGVVDRAAEPRVLSMLEYNTNPALAIEDRANERSHLQRIAEIDAARAAEQSKWRTLQLFGTAGILGTVFIVSVGVYGVVSVRRARLQRGAGAYYIVDDSYPRRLQG
jgi:hypothetical protein